MAKIKTISIAGCGKLAHYFGHVIRNSAAVQLNSIYGRSVHKVDLFAAKYKASPRPWSMLENDQSDLIIFAISDDGLNQVTLDKELKAAVHCSGSMHSGILAPLAPLNGSFYPLQSFDGKNHPKTADVPLFITSDNGQFTKELKDLALRLGFTTYQISDSQRESIHLAAVIAHNFGNYLLGEAYRILSQSGLKFDILAPILTSMLNKAVQQDPTNLQTGPAARDDVGTIESHLKKLEDRPSLKSVYDLISTNIKEKHKAQ